MPLLNLFPLLSLFLPAAVQGPTPLPDAVRRALRFRPAVQAARLRVEAARDGRRGLAAPLGPRLDLQATTNRDLRGNDDDVVLAQPLDLFGRARARRRLGDAQVALAEAEWRAVALGVQDEVVTRYAEAVAATRLAETARAITEGAERLADAARRRADAGAVPEVEAIRAGIERERARQTLALREAGRTAALRRLSASVGEDVTPADFAEITPGPMGEDALRRARPELLRLLAEGETARAEGRIARLDLRPDLEVSARTSPWTYRDQQSGFRAVVSLPLFDTGRVRGEVRAAEGRAKAAEAALADVLIVAGAEIEAASVEAAAAQEAVASFERLREAAQDLARRSQLGYEEGASTLVEVLEANRAVREVEEELVSARLRLALAQAALLRASGRLLEEER